MSGVGVMVGIGLNAAILGAAAGGGHALVKGLSGNFGEDDANAATRASTLQAGAAREGQQVVQGQLDEMSALLQPYTQAGTAALQSQQAQLGLLGPEQQAQAIAAIEASPEFQAMLKQGEEAILQNASATGGLRGGNVQQALMQFRPQLLAQLLNQRFGQLGTLTAGGQQAATNQAGVGVQGSGLIAQLIGDRGAAQAGGVLGAQAARSGFKRELGNNLLAGAGTAAQIGTSLAGGGAF